LSRGRVRPGATYLAHAATVVPTLKASTHQLIALMSARAENARGAVRVAASKASEALVAGTRGTREWAREHVDAHNKLRRDGLHDIWPREHWGRQLPRRIWTSAAQGAAAVYRAGSRWAAGWLGVRWVPLSLAVAITLVMLALVPRAVASIRWTPSFAPPAQATSTVGNVPVVIHPPATPSTRATLSPTPAYFVGAWMANDVPAASGSDAIYVRVTSGADQRPAAGISVTASVTFTCASGADRRAYGPVATDADGVAAIPIEFVGLPTGQPVCVVATAHTVAGAFSATTAFAAG
jgi:hypothetical protein